MEYRDRIRYAVALSVLLHVFGLAAGAYQYTDAGPGYVRGSEPIVIRLKPIEDNEMKRLIETPDGADEPVGETDLISNRATTARDLSSGGAEASQPRLDEVADFDQLGVQPLAAAPETAPEQILEVLEPADEPEPPVTADSGELVSVRDRQEISEAPELDRSRGEKVEETEERPAEERFDLAQADQMDAPLTQDLRVTRGRESEGAESQGFTSFEANRHALGAYMLEIRKHVEREWRMALQLHYSGSSRAYAVLKCSITPEGRLVSVEVVDPGNSVTYAWMCKTAMEKAGLYFRPFPFEVPEIYRRKNLEIQWKFSYM